MPVPRVSAEIHKLNGTYKHDVTKKPKGKLLPPKGAAPLGGPPAFFDADETACWNELREMFGHLLCRTDRWVMETACMLMAKQRRREINSSETARLVNCISLMGGTPADRSRVSANNIGPSEGLDALLQ